jgi:hypothetical protein
MTSYHDFLRLSCILGVTSLLLSMMKTNRLRKKYTCSDSRWQVSDAVRTPYSKINAALQKS